MSRQSKKEIILATAKTLFAEKGYDATGMDEIATVAGVPKSLIYYHFKNKEALLETIIAGLLAAYERLLHDDSERGIDKIARYIDFLRVYRDNVRILVMESLKQTEHRAAIFRMVEVLQGSGKESGDNAHWVTEFFTSILPALLFVCYEDDWRETFGTLSEDLTRDFLDAYRWTHGAYHERIDRESL